MSSYHNIQYAIFAHEYR